MNTADICKTAFDEAFNKIKRQRDVSAVECFEKEAHTYTSSAFFKFGGEEYTSYQFLMEQSERISYNALYNIICTLLKNKCVACQIKNEKEFFIAIPISGSDFSGYYFKNFGLPSALQNTQISDFINDFQQTGCAIKVMKIVCLVSDSAEKAIYNNIDNSPLISLKDFFKLYLTEDDYDVLKAEEIKFTDKVNKYLSVSIVRTLSPNALFGFKQTIDYTIRNFKYELFIDPALTNEQFELIKDQFINSKYYKALIGKNDFAISFLTAEWLFDSIRYSGKIDYTSIAMGYFKAIEQLLFAFISLHTKEKDSQNRTIFVLKKKYVDLEDSVITNDKDAITLQALTSFFGYYKFGTNNIEIRNTDLLNNFIDQSNTYPIIIKMFGSITELRNGYFHKDNITDLETVTKARNTAYLFFFYFLGSYQLSEHEKEQFNIPTTSNTNSFYKLCGYTHYHSRSVYYLFFDDGSKFVCSASNDNKMSFDEYGDATYSGLYFRNLKWAKVKPFSISLNDIMSHRNDAEETLDITEQDLLYCSMSVGEMKPIPDGMQFSGPQTLIYDHGHFCAPTEKDRPSY
ncbi:hypothetical protein [Ruminococcus albus]|uniref:hypothetical protein n=1 Tax=Ruminococcus albus TaxID=1264 RepID=UPI00046462E5|nr:hypothetical protein [Ruminococcus albus]